MNVPCSRGGWTSHGGSKNQLGPDKQHRQSGMLSSGKKGDQSKMPLSKLMWQHSISCHTTLQLLFNSSTYQNITEELFPVYENEINDHGGPLG